MKEFYRFSLMGSMCLGLLGIGRFSAQAQVQTARFISTSANSNGFYEYLPAGYSSGSQLYPLMVFLHGQGELGNGGSDLPTVLRNGPPKLINEGVFPNSFSVGGNTFSFIVLSPQFINWPTEDDVDAVINYALVHYRVDVTRIYVTGLSMGGGVTWDYGAYGGSGAYARKVAAILPVSGAETLGPVGAQNIASADLPVYATHNQDDPTVPSEYTVDNVNLINNSDPPPNPAAVDTIFPVSGHDSWDKTYDPAFTNPRLGNLNVYQWMLQFTRGTVILPVTLTSFTATLSSDRSEVDVNWTTAREQNNRYFTLERSGDGAGFTTIDTLTAKSGAGTESYAYVDRSPLPGKDYYRLSQTDLDGKRTYFSVVMVDFAGETGTTPVIRLSPNPAIDNIHMELAANGEGPLQVSLCDAQGKIIRVWKFVKTGFAWSQTLDLGGLAAGNYFINVKGASINTAYQFVKQ